MSISQHRATKLVPELRNLPYEERLRMLGLPSLFYHRARGDMIEVYKFLHNVYEMPHTLQERAAEGPTRGHSLKLNKKHCRLEVRKNFFSMRVVNNWNSLPEETVRAPCLNTFKARLEKKSQLSQAWVKASKSTSRAYILAQSVFSVLY